MNAHAPTKPRTFSDGDVRMASRRISALVRMNPEARFCRGARTPVVSFTDAGRFG